MLSIKSEENKLDLIPSRLSPNIPINAFSDNIKFLQILF